MEVFLICPRLIPQNVNLTVYEGYIDVMVSKHDLLETDTNNRILGLRPHAIRNRNLYYNYYTQFRIKKKDVELNLFAISMMTGA